MMSGRTKAGMLAAIAAGLALSACNDGGSDVADAEAGYDESAPTLEEVSSDAEFANEVGMDPQPVTNEEVAE